MTLSLSWLLRRGLKTHWLAGLAILVTMALVAFGVDTSRAQNASIIREIRVEGVQRIEPDTVKSYLTFHAGEPFDPAQIDQSLKALYATQLFADVSIRKEGDVVIVSVVENPIINRLAFEGNNRIKTENLEQEVQLK